MVRPVVFCGPSGSGKSTLIKKLFADYPLNFGFSVSHTSRNPRPGEKDGVDYHFVAKTELQKLIEQKLFIESAEFAGNLYGTSIKAVKSVLEDSKNVILDIDMQGVIQMKAQGALKAPLYLFVCPPKIEDLEQRLKGRGTESAESLANRLAVARKEMEWGQKNGSADYIIINDNVDAAYKELVSILIKENVLVSK